MQYPESSNIIIGAGIQDRDCAEFAAKRAGEIVGGGRDQAESPERRRIGTGYCVLPNYRTRWKNVQFAKLIRPGTKPNFRPTRDIRVFDAKSRLCGYAIPDVNTARNFPRRGYFPKRRIDR